MATEPFLGEIRLFSFNFPPKGWLLCNGQLLSINQYQALFAILGTTYGGNGVQDFALPNLQGAVGLHPGNGIVLGGVGGSQTVTLNSSQINHTHLVGANTTANQTTGSGHFPAASPSGQNLYGATANTTMSASEIAPTGGSGAHNNMQPYLVVSYCIATVGIFPSRN
jgi:microcystin-dependent protein